MKIKMDFLILPDTPGNVPTDIWVHWLELGSVIRPLIDADWVSWKSKEPQIYIGICTFSVVVSAR